MADWQTINTMVNRSKDRKSRALERLGSSLQPLADRFAQLRDAKDLREFQSTEAEKARDFQGEQAEADRTYLDTPFDDGPKTYVDPATGEEFTYGTPREYQALLQSQQGVLRKQELERGHELSLDRLSEEQKDRIETIEAELQREQELIDFNRAKYENGSYRTQDGAVFTWNDPETYAAAIDEINQHTRKLASLAQRSPDVWEVYKDVADTAREMMWEPEMDELGNVTGWKRTDVSTEDVLEYFSEQVDVPTMTAEQRAQALEAFGKYLDIIDRSPPQDFQERGDSTSIAVTQGGQPLIRPEIEPEPVSPGSAPYASPFTEEAEDVMGERPGVTRFLLNLFGISPGEAVGDLAEDYYPEGITPAPTDRRGFESESGSAEQRLYDRLMRLAQENPDLTEEILPHVETLIQEERDSYPDIDAFLRRAGIGVGASGGF